MARLYARFVIRPEVLRLRRLVVDEVFVPPMDVAMVDDSRLAELDRLADAAASVFLAAYGPAR